MSVSARVTASLGLMAILCAATAGAGWYGATRVEQEFRKISIDSAPELRVLGELEARGAEMRCEILAVAMLRGDPTESTRERGEMDETFSRLREGVANYEQARSVEATQDRTLGWETIEADDLRLLQEYLGSMEAMRAEVSGPIPLTAEAQASLAIRTERAEARFDSMIQRRIAQEMEEFATRGHAAEVAAGDAKTWSGALALWALILAAILAWRTIAQIVDPLRRLQDVAARLGAGDWTARTGASGPTELATLGATLDAMAARLQATTVSRDSLEAELAARRAAEEQAIQARQEAEAASRAKSQFLANMSHEIRTPLNAVVGVADLLEGTNLDPEQRRLARIIGTSGRGLVGIVQDILDFSKIEAGRRTLDPVDFDLRALVSEAVAVASARLDPMGDVALDWRLDAEAPAWIRADPTALRQILLNLLSNSLKFTKHGSVLLRVDAIPGRETPWLRVSVRDTGIGIAADKLEHVFGEFTQGEEGTTRRYGGTGLGLAICRSLASLMGGTISVRSTLGSGSEFTLEVPVAIALTRPRTEESPSRIRFLGARVLVAEDNLVNQTVIAAMLERLGCICELVPDGRSAVDSVAAAPPALVLMDLQMPKMGGIEATRLIRRTHPRLPIIALTAAVTVEDREAARSAGLNDFLTKPLEASALALALRRWLEPVSNAAAPAPAADA